MVARQFVLRHNGDEFPIDYDTDHGLEILKLQIFSLTSVEPDDQQILAEDERQLVDEGTDLNALSDKLKLVSITEGKDISKPSASQEMSDEELARLLQAEEEALLLQQFSAVDNGEQFRIQVEPYVKQVLMYESPVRQEAARKTVPVDELEEKALVSLAKEGNFNPSKDERDHSFLLQLLFWFKQSFRWVNAPPCDKCGHETSNIGMGAPLPSEIEYGGSRVEIYRCNRCSSITRFPRYNDPLKLVETRRGRCGEWANCFTLYCRAFGYDARLILDFTDHVWTECYSQVHGRWMHLDPCEGTYDNPLLYEKGWGKKLNYAIGISKDGVHDVTRRYTRKWHEVLSRRIIATESAVSSVLSSMTRQCRSNYSAEALSILTDRDRRELEELEKASYLKPDTELSLPGRQSGSVEWRKSRSELGLAETEALSLSSCPVRKCVDAHVSAIHNSFSLLLSQLSDEHASGDRINDVMEVFKKFLLDIKSQPFKKRESSLDLKPFEISEKMKECIEKLLGALSLKGQWGDDREIRVTVTGNPINSSLALPVALDLVDEVINSYKNKVYLKDGVTFPRPNRLCSGMVIASGEQLPVGIATSAFEGTHTNKWEEPNGAKGCWLIYKVPNAQKCDLESYDLMSANDVPERDPMDWVLEASSDGGSSWTVIDRQGSQLFESRFLRKSFKIGTRFVADTFRFRVLSVRDPNSQPRFQIGSIDLYATPNSYPSEKNNL
ncbi:Peptide-N(4)-(N-acetyl-beta-glucosaminyl)asparagine amidase [Rhynchospora pubera]|uniref:Peptide-N(4)-(N-acetyl-beta-glucosaminyl)asparagine amidase n=1 Tax=Rhynchospora pubera TaxID=906938 RepID=A0AAV8G6I9_9POAL|nr:Peptide-N(4)-(N-acetyl-beta-glucosaminyl)asparagine amidase [Rhynchospora pubera]